MPEQPKTSLNGCAGAEMRQSADGVRCERHWIYHDQETVNFWSKPIPARLDLATVVDRFYRPLYRYALSLSHSEADAADLTQQTFFILSKRLDRIRDTSGIKCWLSTTLRHEFLKTVRTRTCHREVEFKPDCYGGAAPDPNSLRGLDTEAVLKALSRVSEPYRRVLQLFYLGELSYKEIARTLEIPTGTVMSRLARGRDELRARLMVETRGVR